MRIVAFISFLTICIFGVAQTGDWDNSTTKTTTTDDVGIGTIIPEGKTEIKYCDPAKNGLIITQSDCGLGAGGGGGSSSGGDLDIEGQIGNTIPAPIDLKYSATPSLTSRPILWGRVENHTFNSTSGSVTANKKTKIVALPSGRVGINLDNPRSELDVINPNTDKGLNQPVAIFGVLNNPTSNQDQHTRHIQIVPNLSKGTYNPSTNDGDLGLFYTDGLKQDGLNDKAGLVIAPWNKSASTNGVFGIRITHNGEVGIGTRLENNPNNYLLAVNGIIGAKEVNVEEISSTWWPDYVFEQDYSLLTIKELEVFINNNKHLPNIPTAEDVSNHGVNLADMNAKLLRKVEELSLYIIELNKRLEQLENNKDDEN